MYTFSKLISKFFLITSFGYSLSGDFICQKNNQEVKLKYKNKKALFLKKDAAMLCRGLGPLFYLDELVEKEYNDESKTEYIVWDLSDYNKRIVERFVKLLTLTRRFLPIPKEDQELQKKLEKNTEDFVYQLNNEVQHLLLLKEQSSSSAVNFTDEYVTKLIELLKHADNIITKKSSQEDQASKQSLAIEKEELYEDASYSVSNVAVVNELESTSLFDLLKLGELYSFLLGPEYLKEAVSRHIASRLTSKSCLESFFAATLNSDLKLVFEYYDIYNEKLEEDMQDRLKKAICYKKGHKLWKLLFKLVRSKPSKSFNFKNRPIEVRAARKSNGCYVFPLFDQSNGRKISLVNIKEKPIDYTFTPDQSVAFVLGYHKSEKGVNKVNKISLVDTPTGKSTKLSEEYNLAFSRIKCENHGLKLILEREKGDSYELNLEPILNSFTIEQLLFLLACEYIKDLTKHKFYTRVGNYKFFVLPKNSIYKEIFDKFIDPEIREAIKERYLLECS